MTRHCPFQDLMQSVGKLTLGQTIMSHDSMYTLLALKDVQLTTHAGHTWSFAKALNAATTRALEIDTYWY